MNKARRKSCNDVSTKVDELNEKVADLIARIKAEIETLPVEGNQEGAELSEEEGAKVDARFEQLQAALDALESLSEVEYSGAQT